MFEKYKQKKLEEKATAMAHHVGVMQDIAKQFEDAKKMTDTGAQLLEVNRVYKNTITARADFKKSKIGAVLPKVTSIGLGTCVTVFAVSAVACATSPLWAPLVALSLPVAVGVTGTSMMGGGIGMVGFDDLVNKIQAGRLNKDETAIHFNALISEIEEYQLELHKTCDVMKIVQSQKRDEVFKAFPKLKAKFEKAVVQKALEAPVVPDVRPAEPLAKPVIDKYKKFGK